MPVSASASLQPRDDDPDWLAALRAAARDASIARAGAAIGMSRTAVSLVLSGTYPGATIRVEARVRAKLMGQVNCPGLDRSITIDRCRDQATKPFSATSGRAAALWRACRTCPHSRIGGSHD
jgi:hypothetical protein